jgi:hypothetical protein
MATRNAWLGVRNYRHVTNNQPILKGEFVKRKNAAAVAISLLVFPVFSMLAAQADAQNQVDGKLEVKGKPIAMTQVYAYAVEGFFDKKKQDVTVLFCDAAVPATAVRDYFARKALVDAGKLHCVQQVINAEKQVINFEVRDNRFGARQPGGGSTEHVFEARTFDGKTIAGRSRTKSPQTSFDDVPYAYDMTFSAAIEPKK